MSADSQQAILDEEQCPASGHGPVQYAADAAPRLGSPWLRTVVYGSAFVAGFSVMSAELLGGRVLAPYFGAGIYIWGSLISVFLLALSVGYLAGGRMSLVTPSLRRFSLLFCAAAILLVPLVLLDEPLMHAISLHMSDLRYASLVAALVLFAAPTLFLGAVSPYALRLLVVSRATSGHTAGKLYFLSTLGSALGALVTSFYLVLWLTVETIAWMLAGILLGCALLCWVIRA